ncbi:carbohydrate ABC transporter permease (plasmid) [Deinococcus metallilatus]|uniref:Carbohydrate ABC transporter permease n=2 Tax=Deinococcus metallilatus TaxID=1211322 RepID=A0AAJ5F7N2_9DEIO|nr:carbohydrate ABC transporter permease [Deinococcus metallilatus]MBB5295679.1 multiple sugar transport system permease protein [Deinococcus metallilatus]QBY06866.1 carbohydrate ABC transporter permease [Deinococcus metallilatus]TLK32255.1 carbohydrate ABC transporter permease [Deinococcus metallilatus]GMA14208.1 ABC transporter permease [Deinococcus metallilatus]
MRGREVAARLAFGVVTTLLATFFALPCLWLVLAPFNARATLATVLPSPPSLTNFRAVLGNHDAVVGLLNSGIQALGSMLLTVAVAALAAYALSRARVPGARAFTAVLLMFSSVVSGTVAMVPIYNIILKLGLIDTQLGVILVMTGGLLPTAIFLLLDFVNALPKSYEESAAVCGARPWQYLPQVIFPLIRPGLMVVGVWAFVGVWGSFLTPYILLRSNSNLPASVQAYQFYNDNGQPVLTLVSAYSFLYVLPVLLLYLWVNWRYGFRFFGGIKG